ncbi:hypothetical protein B0H19DRAFT_1069408 [Mycena capillaripes]|nr:hypothetical protein B0H19DRAFT_1069408 [Mycena capillaripes]
MEKQQLAPDPGPQRRKSKPVNPLGWLHAVLVVFGASGVLLAAWIAGKIGLQFVDKLKPPHLALYQNETWDQVTNRSGVVRPLVSGDDRFDIIATVWLHGNSSISSRRRIDYYFKSSNPNDTVKADKIELSGSTEVQTVVKVHKVYWQAKNASQQATYQGDRYPDAASELVEDSKDTHFHMEIRMPNMGTLSVWSDEGVRPTKAQDDIFEVALYSGVIIQNATLSDKGLTAESFIDLANQLGAEPHRRTPARILRRFSFREDGSPSKFLLVDAGLRVGNSVASSTCVTYRPEIAD